MLISQIQCNIIYLRLIIDVICAMIVIKELMCLGIQQGRELQICWNTFIIKNYGQQSTQNGLLPILLLIWQKQIKRR